MITDQGEAAADGARATGRWADAETWIGDGMRRETFFFDAQGSALYGSVYAAAVPMPVGVLLCNSWGYEANLAGRIVHPLSIAVARAGGVAVHFHYPGFGDSLGDFEATTMDVMADATVDALAEASRRHPGTRWTVGGLMLGASVAVLATARGAPVEELLLLQPALRPGDYFARLERASKRPLGGPAPEPTPGFAYGYPLAPRVLASARAADTAVEAALAGFTGTGANVRYAKPEPAGQTPPRFEQIDVDGSWRFGKRDNPALIAAAAAWLRKRVEAAR